MAAELRARRLERSSEYSETTRRGPRNWHSRHPCRRDGWERRGGQISEQGKGRPERRGDRAPQEKIRHCQRIKTASRRSSFAKVFPKRFLGHAPNRPSELA